MGQVAPRMHKQTGGATALSILLRFSCPYEPVFLYNGSVVQQKCGIQNCNNYRGIKLLSHTMKVWERVVEMRVRRGVSSQFGFMPREINHKSYPSCEEIDGEILRKEERLTYGVH